MDQDRKYLGLRRNERYVRPHASYRHERYLYFQDYNLIETKCAMWRGAWLLLIAVAATFLLHCTSRVDGASSCGRSDRCLRR